MVNYRPDRFYRDLSRSLVMNRQRVESDVVLWKPVRSFYGWRRLEELKKSVLQRAFEGEL